MKSQSFETRKVTKLDEFLEKNTCDATQSSHDKLADRN